VLPKRRNSTLAALACSLLIASCSARDVTEPPGGAATLNVTADVSAAAVAMVVVEVTAPDISPSLVFNLAINPQGVATGTITIPAGSSRTITMSAYDSSGTETHRGSVTKDILAGLNPTIPLVLTPLTGDIPITATLGSITVTVTPSPATLAVGAADTLVATIRDSNGNPVAGSARWATRNPGVASVTSEGVVTGVAAGQTSIVATFQGAAGSATVTVTGP
jgi:zona occludens toxin (predicted ATPase)